MAVDPMAKMLCSMLKIKPEDLQGVLANIGGAANFFKGAVDRIEAEQKAQRALLERIAANVGSNGSGGNIGTGSGNGDGASGTLIAAE